MFTEKDLRQIEARGLTLGQVEAQLENFRRGFPFLKVVRAASPGDGVTLLDAAAADAAVARYERDAARLGVVKFVPASGAATRMFKELFEFVNEGRRGKGVFAFDGRHQTFAPYTRDDEKGRKEKTDGEAPGQVELTEITNEDEEEPPF